MSAQDKKQALDTMPKRIGFSLKKILWLAVCVGTFLSFMVLMVIKYRTPSVKKEDVKQQNNLLIPSKRATPERLINQMHQANEKGGSLTRYHQLYENRRKAERQGGIKEVVNAQKTQSSSDQSLTKAALRAKERREKREKFLNEIASSPITVENHAQVESHPIKDVPNEHRYEEEKMKMAMMAAANYRPSNYAIQNQQDEKKAFLTKAENTSNFYLDAHLQKPLSNYEVKAGTLIPATFETGINSDLPGTITARVARNIYDTVSGNYLLIPQGTKILGYYDSQIAYGQERILMVWSRLIFPNGDSFDLQGQPGVDLAGMSGIADKVDHHTFKVFGSALMFSLFGAAGQLSQPKNETNQFPSNGQIIFGAIGQQLTQTGAQLVMRNMDIQPTIEIRPAAKFNILLTKDMVLPGAYPQKVKEITIWQRS